MRQPWHAPGMRGRFRTSKLRVAIVGAGPAGFYTLDALLRAEVPLEVDLIDRLPTPFGLVRGGVAPDHQHTKAVDRAFEALLDRPEVRFWGDVELGRDIHLAELRGLYDAVVLAIGAPTDRALEIPGEELEGVYGSAAFVGWYNGHPDWQHLDPPLDGRPAVVVGNGNVALDIARVLLKTPKEMAASDLSEPAAAKIAAHPPEVVTILGRRGPLQARFTLAELRELGSLEVGPPAIVRNEQLPALPDQVAAAADEREGRRAERVLAALRGFEDTPVERARLRFRFFARPLEALGEGRLEALRCQGTAFDEEGLLVDAGPPFDLPCGLLISAIGYVSEAVEGAAFDPARGRFRSQGPRLEPGLYAAGWCLRGPSGVIGTNKHDGDAAAAAILAEVKPAAKPGRVGLHGILTGRQRDWVARDGWRAIDAEERAAAADPAPRRKLTSYETLRTAARQAQQG